MQKSILQFSHLVLSRDQMKKIKGGGSYECTMYFDNGGATYQKKATVSSTTCDGAETRNDMCTVNGSTCYTRCKAHEA